MRKAEIASVLAPALATLLGIGTAGAADAVWPAEAPASTMQCGEPSVLSRIERRFAYSEREVWNRGFVIDTLSNARPSGHPYYEPGIVKRDYCVADSVMTNGAAYPVYYTIEHNVGFVGIGTYVDFCVLGLDPWHVHDGFCRTVR